MDLSSPLSSLIPSVDAVVLEALAGSAHCSWHRRRRATNHGAVYRLNREHLLASSVLAAARARRELLQRLGDACGRLTPTPISACVFGSVARNEAGLESDIDLLIIVDGVSDVDDWADQIYELTTQVEARTGNRLEVITQSTDHLAGLVRVGEPIVASWQRDAITVYGTELGAVLLGVQPSMKDLMLADGAHTEMLIPERKHARRRAVIPGP